ITVVALTWVYLLPATIMAQAPDDDDANTQWHLDAMIHLQRMRVFHDKDTDAQTTPSTIPQRTMDADPSGIISSYQPNGDTQTSSNAFFQNLGTNGRTCFTCHQTQTAWSVSAQSVQDRFNSSSGNDPIFRLVDRAICLTADIPTLQNKLQAYSLL